MPYLHSIRRIFILLIVSFAFILLYRITFHLLHRAFEVAYRDINNDTLLEGNEVATHPTGSWSHHCHSHYPEPCIKNNGSGGTQTCPRPTHNPYLASLFRCESQPNPHTNHIRIHDIVQNISQVAPRVVMEDSQQKFNPTIIALPYWSENRYLLVSRVVTEGLHQESLMCEANICYSNVGRESREGEKECTVDDVTFLGPAGGLRCAHLPVVVDIPPTPAERCEGVWSAFPDIPGFHDPRIFWSGRGEPLIIVNSASQYACLGLWMTDLRTLYEPLKKLLSSQTGQVEVSSPDISYPRLAELTRTPETTRSPVEKNWFLFFPTPFTSYIHYDLSSPPHPHQSMSSNFVGRTFAELTENGATSPNLTDPLELPCLQNGPDFRGEFGHWHQATNALKLILCYGSEARAGKCDEKEEGRSVHFAVIHRKYSNPWKLPLRYERFLIIFSTRPPFHMLAISKHPLLFWNETASGWTPGENWAVETRGEALQRASFNRSVGRERSFNETATINSTNSQYSRLQKDQMFGRRRGNWAYFTYTPSIAWAWRPKSRTVRQGYRMNGHGKSEYRKGNLLESLNIGYLDDEVILGIGLDDNAQTFARAKAETLLQCMQACPGRREPEEDSLRVNEPEQQKKEEV